MRDDRDITDAGTPSPGEADLRGPDADALEALLDAGLDLRRVDPGLRDRAERVGALLGLLARGSVEGRGARIEAVMRAVGGADRRAGAESPELTSQDSEALDAWVLASFDVSKVPASLRDRARAHEALAALVRAGGPVSSEFERDDLISRTMAALDKPADPESYKFVAPSSRSRWTDLLSVAAVMLISVSILWPVLTTVRDGARRSVCESNMRTVAQAMGAYTNDENDTLPMTASLGGGTWWNVGREHSNSANLYTLAREDYLKLGSLACPGNPQAVTAPRSPDARDWSNLDEISYSYRVMAHPERELWGTPSELVIVSDRSPVVLRAVHQRRMFPYEPSPNHRGRGQHALFADGSFRWMDTPVLASGDNIWLPKPIEVFIDVAARRQGLEPLKGTEAPADRTDSFVGP